MLNEICIKTNSGKTSVLMLLDFKIVVSSVNHKVLVDSRCVVVGINSYSV